MSTRTTVLSKEEIQHRVIELGQQISCDYQGEKLVTIGILNGAFIFMADLCRALAPELSVEVDFIRVSSYGKETESSGTIRLSKEPEIDFQEKHVLLVEDIVDTGNTLFWLERYFRDQGAKSVKACALIDKIERRTQNVQVDYAGFSLNKGFLIGYGLDHGEKFRHLSEVYSIG